jgi:hypothetical protein
MIAVWNRANLHNMQLMNQREAEVHVEHMRQIRTSSLPAALLAWHNM